jgi:hypothetical protein
MLEVHLYPMRIGNCPRRYNQVILMRSTQLPNFAYDFLAPPCEDLTIGTITVDPETYADAMRLAAEGSLSVDDFHRVDPIISAGKNVYSLADEALLADLIPDGHRLAVCEGRHDCPLEFRAGAACQSDFTDYYALNRIQYLNPPFDF